MLDQYASLSESFRWLVPTHFNIAQECCHRWANSSADARRIALFFEDASGQREIWTYERLGAATRQCANALIRMGVKPGDRVAIMLGQTPEAVVVHLGAFSVGAVAVPLSAHLVPKALEFRLRDAEARVAIVGSEASTALLSVLPRCSKLTQLVGVGVTDDRLLPWRNLMLRQSEQFSTRQTHAEDPALLLYDSGAGHTAKGVLLSHRALLGNLPGFVAAHNWFPQGAEVFWTPLDWAHSAALLSGLLPTLYFGKSILGVRGTTTPGQAQDLLTRYRISHALMPSAVLRQIRLNTPAGQAPLSPPLRSLSLNDKDLDDALITWCEHFLGVAPNAFFGVNAMPCLAGDSRQKWQGKLGSLGKVYPGHQLAVLRQEGTRADPDEVGELAVNRYDSHQHLDPAFPLRYWRAEPDGPHSDPLEWWRTGVLAHIDKEGYLWHAGPMQSAPLKTKPVPPVPPVTRLPLQDAPHEQA